MATSWSYAARPGAPAMTPGQQPMMRVQPGQTAAADGHAPGHQLMECRDKPPMDQPGGRSRPRGHDPGPWPRTLGDGPWDQVQTIWLKCQFIKIPSSLLGRSWCLESVCDFGKHRGAFRCLSSILRQSQFILVHRCFWQRLKNLSNVASRKA